MASLSVSQAIEAIKQPKSGKEIYRAKLKRERHRLHTEPETECDNSFLWSRPHIRFLEWVARLLKSDDNYNRFKDLYRPPIATNELVGSIFSQFEKVFESENKYEKFNFTEPDILADAQDYRKCIGDFTFWETQGFERMKDSIDDILIIDLPRLDPKQDAQANDISDDGDQYPEPYYYLLDIESVIDIENTRVKALDYEDEEAYFFRTEYIIFREDKKTVCVFDDNFYRTFTYDGSGEPKLISETPHDLGYCPARSFWTTPLNSRTNILKRGPITESISNLDWLEFQSVAAQYLKMYAVYPIYAVYKGICTYKDPINKTRCVDGFMVSEQWKGMYPEKSNPRCPKCSNKMKTGPGNILELVAPQNNDEPDLLKNPMKVIPADEISVKVVNEELKCLKEDIFKSCVGGNIEVDQTQAKNQDQVAAAFESKTNKLMWVKKNFETIHSFAIDTVFRLRYGEKYISGVIDYGDVFFQKDETTAMEEYVKAKEQQLPAFDLSIRRDKINESRYRNNPDMIQRLDILKNLDPFPDDDIISISVTLSNMPEIVDPVDLCIKTHFNRFIARFEREQASILLFGAQLTFDTKIKTIYAVLQSYATEYLTQRKTNIITYPLTPPEVAIPTPTIRTKESGVPVQ
jgi:hypothetical protein